MGKLCLKCYVPGKAVVKKTGDVCTECRSTLVGKAIEPAFGKVLMMRPERPAK